MISSWSRKQIALVIIAPALVLTEIAAFQLLVHFMGDTWGYLLGYVVYWFVWCIPVSVLFLNTKLKERWRLPTGVSSAAKAHWIALTLAALPALATGLAVFPTYALSAGWKVILLALLFAIINAPLEELLWRGVFPAVFPDSFRLGFVFPALCFGAWHLAPALAKDSGMGGGVLGFAGSALFMGMLWGWYAYRYRTVIPSTTAHLLTNWFAFTGFLFVNWFA